MDVDSDSDDDSDSHSTTSAQTNHHIFGPLPTSSQLGSQSITATSTSSKPHPLPIPIPYHLWDPSTARFFSHPRIFRTPVDNGDERDVVQHAAEARAAGRS
jgi:hypothetical protein